MYKWTDTHEKHPVMFQISKFIQVHQKILPTFFQIRRMADFLYFHSPNTLNTHETWGFPKTAHLFGSSQMMTCRRGCEHSLQFPGELN